MSGGRDSVELGPVEWAVVTSHLVPSGLFVRLEESGEEAFVDITSVHNHPLCRNPEYWPDVGERIRVRAVGRRPSGQLQMSHRESALDGVLGGLPTRDPSVPPGLGPIERAVVVAHREGGLRVRLVESGRVCALPAALVSDDPTECAEENWPAVGERIRVRRLGVWPGGEVRVSRTMFTDGPVPGPPPSFYASRTNRAPESVVAYTRTLPEAVVGRVREAADAVLRLCAGFLAVGVCLGTARALHGSICPWSAGCRADYGEGVGGAPDGGGEWKSRSSPSLSLPLARTGTTSPP